VTDPQNNNANDYVFRVDGDPSAPGNVKVRFELCFVAAAQTLQALADQNLHAAAMEILYAHQSPDCPINVTPLPPVTFSLVGVLTASGSEDGCTDNPGKYS
jgi:hypothetical protein